MEVESDSAKQNPFLTKLFWTFAWFSNSVVKGREVTTETFIYSVSQQV